MFIINYNYLLLHMIFTEEQLKKEKRNIIVLTILTFIWFGFFLHNSITVDKQYKQMEKISHIISTNNQQILKNQELILERQSIIIDIHNKLTIK